MLFHLTGILADSIKAVVSIAVMVLIAVAAVAYAQSADLHSLAKLPPDLNAQSGRPCIMPSGGWTIINCSNAAAASSAQLNAYGRYVMQCGDDSYLAAGTAATGQDADSSDGWIPSGAWFEFLTTDTVRFMSCLNKNLDSDCRYFECR